MRLRRIIHNRAGDIIDTKVKVQPFLYFIILVGIQFYVLFGNGTVGLSDNGDYIRVMRPNYIVSRETGQESRFVLVETYYLEPPGSRLREKAINAIITMDASMSYPSLQHLFIKFAAAANIVFNRITSGEVFAFHIGALGLLYIIMHSAALALLMDNLQGKGLLRDILLKAAAAVIFCDIGYIAYFNSFYGEAPQLILFTTSAALGMRLLKNKGTGRDAALFCAALTAFAWTKFANIPAAALTLALTAAPMCYLRKDAACRRRVAAALAISFVMLAGIWAIVPRWMDMHTNYNAVFFGILRDEKAPGPILAELGLPQYMSGLAGTTYYAFDMSGIASMESFTEDFSRLSKLDIALYYFRHPGIFAEKLRITAKHSGFIRPPYLSNRNISYSRMVFDDSFSIWEQARKELPFDTLWFNALVVVLFTLIAMTGAYITCTVTGGGKAYGLMAAALILSLAGIALYSFAVPVISNGEADLAKHMFAFTDAIDLMILIGIYLVINSIPDILGLKLHNVTIATAAAMLLIAVFLVDSAYPRPLKPFGIRTGEVEKIRALSFIELGEYKGEKLLWQAVRDEGDSYLLICSTSVDMHPFSRPVPSSRFGSNLWRNSDIRMWLNTEFVNAFNPREKELILEHENKYLLTLGNIDLRKGGDKDFYWNHIPELADRGYERAYYDLCVDKVFLPDVRDISRAYRLGADIRREMPYWLETPYFYDTSMVRAVFRDGYIYMKDAAVDEIGVVPAVRIKKAAFFGSGTLESPYRVKY